MVEDIKSLFSTFQALVKDGVLSIASGFPASLSFALVFFFESDYRRTAVHVLTSLEQHAVLGATAIYLGGRLLRSSWHSLWHVCPFLSPDNKVYKNLLSSKHGNSSDLSKILSAIAGENGGGKDASRVWHYLYCAVSKASPTYCEDGVEYYRFFRDFCGTLSLSSLVGCLSLGWLLYRHPPNESEVGAVWAICIVGAVAALVFWDAFRALGRTFDNALVSAWLRLGAVTVEPRESRSKTDPPVPGG